MNLDTFLVIASIIGTVVCYAGYRYFSANVKLTYKDQRVGGSRHG